MQLKRNIKATCDEGFKELMNYSHWRANPALILWWDHRDRKSHHCP